jgi:hypothetical protein
MKRQPIQLFDRPVPGRIMRTMVTPRIKQPISAGRQRFNQASGKR